MHRFWLMIVMLGGLAAAQAAAGLEIYFVRHAETLANASGENHSGNSNTLSTRGHEQANRLARTLKGLHFDAILVSPTGRALDTIRPYLQESGQKGEIWPELTECCWQHERDNLGTGQLILRSTLRLRDEQQPFFTFRDAGSMRAYGNDSYADGVAQVRHAVELLRQHYFNSSKTILIVAHYHSGQVLLAELLGVSREKLPNLENAGVTHLRQGKDGHFALITINGEKALTP